MSSSISNRSSLWFLAITLLSFLAASTAPTPLYHLYQEHLQFSAATLTLIFGVYAISLLAALLTVGSLSDYLGRKPVIFTAVALNMLAMLLFINADSVAWLISARVLQGFATGMATAALGAALLDTDRQQGPLVNSVAPLLGMAAGAMGCGLLAEFAPLPLQLTFWVLLAMFGLQALYVWRLPESVSAQRGALASLRPTLHVPIQARRALWLVLPINTAAWALGGFYASLAPSLVRTATGSTSNLIGGATVAVLTVTGALMIYTLRSRPADKVLRVGASILPVGVALILLAVHSASLPLFFIGTLVAGCGFGASFLGALRSVVPLALPHERAGLMSAFYVLSYLAFCLPSLLAGNLTRAFGLVTTTDGYGAVLIILAVSALPALMRQQPAKVCGADAR
ncbi:MULTISPECIES: MFS transporter [Pseudomonas]|jgi:MFS family permease|uniref:Major facilitator superfamily (MFS) profile domain-containing protein n=1 Tax=Pseudomonas fluorescens TaxID=294 RepID=A0A5E7JQR1_PSEFL|nr:MULTISPECIES: MFS transporter [Pseudomonas]MBU0523792.1 MFS transporter [Gammaproteobacteria bacterium]MBU0820037.1 MFS transporter [Gammaproteobacteria bacterium]MBU0844824.1 MFS transporter [Gammaproteobacteria bacterium]MBU1838474.1 MFS transporter [Gammaproteobacteria bacterium]MDO8403546.1 MFS transporter [Pseudomonas sp.]